MDVDAIIKAAKLGSERKDAQVDTCTVFAAALAKANQVVQFPAGI